MYALPPLNSTFIPPLGSLYFPSTPPPHPIARLAPVITENRSALRIHELFITLSLPDVVYCAASEIFGLIPLNLTARTKGTVEPTHNGLPKHITQDGSQNRHSGGNFQSAHRIKT